MATSLKAIAFAEALGFTGNQKLLSADRLLKSQIGFSPLEAMGQKQLVAPCSGHDVYAYPAWPNDDTAAGSPPGK
ncbi:hypothetical protein ACTL6P_22995 [Endozoicomonas acroporae]|uniref:hypothetical protein n=1 Tax=Endozoicomonas acroporae TaxID=1701104 RepID=UPI000C759035|nr:hypothetical protein [Endozoicomonas acroporae]